MFGNREVVNGGSSIWCECCRETRGREATREGKAWHASSREHGPTPLPKSVLEYSPHLSSETLCWLAGRDVMDNIVLGLGKQNVLLASHLFLCFSG